MQSEGAGTLDGLTVEVEHGIFENFMSLTLAYGTVLTDAGRTQYAFLSVSVSESLRLHPTSMAQSNGAKWEQLSPRPPYSHNGQTELFPSFHTQPKVSEAFPTFLDND